jgi:hypothetical protein
MINTFLILTDQHFTQPIDLPHHPSRHIELLPALCALAQLAGVVLVEPQADTGPVEGVPALEDGVVASVAQAQGEEEAAMQTQGYM